MADQVVKTPQPAFTVEAGHESAGWHRPAELMHDGEDAESVRRDGTATPVPRGPFHDSEKLFAMPWPRRIATGQNRRGGIISRTGGS